MDFVHYILQLALIKFKYKIIQYLDEGNKSISIFFDPTKDRDTVEDEILLQKLEQYGIQGHANDFFRTYLANRRQYMVVNDVKSLWSKIECGVPQGLVF